ncbi:hypothetical protein ACR784_23795 [Sphingobacterium multivorum]|uniref:hypothetical protein n=1 Tax=Sphingobacterium multivorum TaxID=28454 RepID=UPI003DA52A19
MNWTPENYYFTKLNKNELPELIHFYLVTTQQHYKLDSYSEEEYAFDFESLIGEDQIFFDRSIYYVLRSKLDNCIQASIRITFWDAYSDDVDPIPGILTPLILVQGLSLPMT